MAVSEFIPKSGLSLVKYSGKQFVDKLGLEIVQNVVGSVLKGRNVRDLTEGLTQRRILLLSSSIITTYLRALSSYENFEEMMTALVHSDITSRRLSPDKKSYLCWFLGLTGKSIQNVIRDGSLSEYVTVFDENLKDICKDVENLYGDISLNVSFEGKEAMLKWPNLLRCLLAVGAQTLATRGSEKSLYGKAFEKFVLLSVLEILGFSFIQRTDTSKNKLVFWLSERLDKRESDATALVKPGTGIRFDIGFIGKGNTEISLDKVSRFERIMERGGSTFYTSTITLVDNIGDNSRISYMAKEIDGTILQMRETYWVYQLALVLKEKCGYSAEILTMTKEESLEYIDKRMREIDLNKFV